MTSFDIRNADNAQLQALQQQLQQAFDQLKAAGLNLDLTRGKPGSEQLSLSNALDGILAGNYTSDSGTDTRNYGGLDGLPECKAMFADIMQVTAEEILIGGNSSLTLMYQAVLFAWLFGYGDKAAAWKDDGKTSFLCPVPGYDRHFAICEAFGINMISVPMNEHGPDMDQVEKLVREDKSIKGMWCVPRFSNPSGIVYSDETVDRIARLGQIAAGNFRVFWDNAYAIHSFTSDAPALAPIMDACRRHGTEDSVLQFGSTSKVTFAGAGLAYMAASKTNLAAFGKHLGMSSIGPDKINQLRHLRFFNGHTSFAEHMKKHAALLKPRFDIVLDKLAGHFSNSDALQWTVPEGGYFVSVDTRPGLAKRVVALAGELGVKLTPAGATFPYGKDPQDSNIRIAPSFPSLADIDKAMDVFVLCVKLATVEQALA